MQLTKFLKIGAPIALSSVAIVGASVSLTSCSLIQNLKKIDITKHAQEQLLNGIKEKANEKINNSAEKLGNAIKKFFNENIHRGIRGIQLTLDESNPKKLSKVVFEIDKTIIKEVVIEKEVSNFKFDEKTYQLEYSFPGIPTNIPNK